MCVQTSDCLADLECYAGQCHTPASLEQQDTHSIPYHEIAWPILGFSAVLGVVVQIVLQRREVRQQRLLKEREANEEQAHRQQLRRNKFAKKGVKALRSHGNSFTPAVISNGSFSNRGSKQCLEAILHHEERSKAFYAFCKSKFAHENILFWNAINGYDAAWANIPVDREKTEKAGNEIVEDFVLDSGKFEVNIAHRVRLQLLATHVRACNAAEGEYVFLPNTFQEAKHEIFSLMNTNFCADFISHENEQERSLEVV